MGALDSERSNSCSVYLCVLCRKYIMQHLVIIPNTNSVNRHMLIKIDLVNAARKISRRWGGGVFLILGEQ